jgi:hypothetical protein
LWASGAASARAASPAREGCVVRGRADQRGLRRLDAPGDVGHAAEDNARRRDPPALDAERRRDTDQRECPNLPIHRLEIGVARPGGGGRDDGHRFPPAIIGHAVWLYFRFAPSYRDAELLLAERGVIVPPETIRQWCQKFGQTYANEPRRRRP